MERQGLAPLTIWQTFKFNFQDILAAFIACIWLGLKLSFHSISSTHHCGRMGTDLQQNGWLLLFPNYDHECYLVALKSTTYVCNVPTHTRISNYKCENRWSIFHTDVCKHAQWDNMGYIHLLQYLEYYLTQAYTVKKTGNDRKCTFSDILKQFLPNLFIGLFSKMYLEKNEWSTKSKDVKLTEKFKFYQIFLILNNANLLKNIHIKFNIAVCCGNWLTTHFSPNTFWKRTL